MMLSIAHIITLTAMAMHRRQQGGCQRTACFLYQVPTALGHVQVGEGPMQCRSQKVRGHQGFTTQPADKETDGQERADGEHLKVAGSSCA